MSHVRQALANLLKLILYSVHLCQMIWLLHPNSSMDVASIVGSSSKLDGVDTTAFYAAGEVEWLVGWLYARLCIIFGWSPLSLVDQQI